jgi:hypothetical protein
MWYFRHLENVVDQSTSGWVGARRICQPKDKFPWASLTFIEDYYYVRFYLRLPGSPQKKPTVTLDAPINAPTRLWTSTLFWKHKTSNGSNWPRGKITTTNAPHTGFDTQRRPFALENFLYLSMLWSTTHPLFLSHKCNGKYRINFNQNTKNILNQSTQTPNSQKFLQLF